MDLIDLCGEWQFRQTDEKQTTPARVPGCVHGDLLAAGTIQDPFFRDEEDRVAWIGCRDWVYSREFRVPAAFLDHERILLVCHGLDTVATITVNGQPVGNADNMFRVWEFDVKDAVRAGENTLEIHFQSPMTYVAKKNAARAVPAWGVGAHKRDSGSWIRKEPCNFGWDWGPSLVTCGIWRDIALVGFSTARLKSMHVTQRHTGKRVTLDVGLEADKCGRARLAAAVTVTYRGAIVAENRADFTRNAAMASLEIPDPRLWWPNGMGGQPLYEVTVDLLDAEDALLDTDTKRVGLRTLELRREKDKWGESFAFAVNGLPFFAKGANWIPADAILSRLTYDDYHRLLTDSVDANMNMLRVWGGGIYEHDSFYDLCDELGLCVWQDFMFACATYPAFDRAFMANVREEARDNVRRLRHHPSIALWCGNNELEQGLVADKWTDHSMSWTDYSRLFDKLLPEVVGELDPERTYWPCSPHSPIGDRRDFNNPTCGDAHLWSVWHGRQPFEWYRTCEHRFNSEFGFQSFPEPKTVRGYTVSGDRNITSPIMEHHQRSGIGNVVILQYMLDWFRMPSSFDNTLWLSQILQGMAMKYAVEHWRRSMPRGMGTLYWQLNDCWPVASWASIDSHGRWKALHHMARNFYAPVLISGVEDLDHGTVDVFATSDLLCAVDGEVRWMLCTVDGAVLVEDAFAVKLGSRRSAKVKRLELDEPLESYGPRNLLLWLELATEDGVVSTNLITFARPKQLELPDPEIAVSVKARGDNAFEVSIQAKKPALWTWLEVSSPDVRLSDNFFHLVPGRKVRIELLPARPMTLAQLEKRLKVRSLVDTF